MNKMTGIVLGLLLSATSAQAGNAVTVTLNPSADNSLFESSTGSLSNGAGLYLFAGLTNRVELRRGLVRFNLSSIPAGSTIQSATLTMTVSRSISGALDMSLHTVNNSWGEGASDAPGQEGTGTTAQNGDATWLHRFYPTQLWQQPGGDYRSTPSATTAVGGNGSYVWSSADLAGDVQRWLDAPAINHGWAIIGAEGVTASAKRLDASEGPVPPALAVTYIPGTAPQPPAAVGIPATSWPTLVLLVLLIGFAARRASIISAKDSH